MSKPAINGIKQKEATTTQERLLLGLLSEESARIEFGKIVIEFTVRAGKIDRASLTETTKHVNIGLRDQAGQSIDRN